jgi:hypothetical protein
MILFNLGLTYGFAALGDMTGVTLPSAYMALPDGPGSPLYSVAGAVCVCGCVCVWGGGAWCGDMNDRQMQRRATWPGLLQRPPAQQRVAWRPECVPCRVACAGGVTLIMVTIFLLGILATKAEPALNGEQAGARQEGQAHGAAKPVTKHAVALCCAVLCCAVLCCAVLCCAVLCCAVLCCAVLCCAVLCCAVLCGAVPCVSRVLLPPPPKHTRTHTQPQCWVTLWRRCLAASSQSAHSSGLCASAWLSVCAQVRRGDGSWVCRGRAGACAPP